MIYQAKGKMIFVHTNEGINVYEHVFEEEWQKETLKKEIYHLIDGKEFLESIESGVITNYDGEIANIFVDGYDSNLGIFYKEFYDGGFLVDKETFLELCDDLKIEVNWANK